MRQIKSILRFLLFTSIILTIFSCSDQSDEPIDDNNEEALICDTNTFFIRLDPSECAIDIQNNLSVSSLYSESLGTERTIQTNSIPNHKVGMFPNSGNPNTISVVDFEYQTSLSPTKGSSSTSAQGYTFGILMSGVSIDPFTAEYFKQSNNESNRDWNITTLTNAVNLGLDCNNAHVQPSGKYHYHGTPSAMLSELDNNGETMIHVGFAADGFPIYYKYVEIEGAITTAESGYSLKEGERPGDGNSAPDGCYDGTYFQDYEYVSGTSVLDACNGMTGKTPDSESEYFYVITDNFPSAPLCFTGTPDNSFRNGAGPGPSGSAQPHHHILLE